MLRKWPEPLGRNGQKDPRPAVVVDKTDLPFRPALSCDGEGLGSEGCVSGMRCDQGEEREKPSRYSGVDRKLACVWGRPSAARAGDTLRGDRWLLQGERSPLRAEEVELTFAVLARFTHPPNRAPPHFLSRHCAPRPFRARFSLFASIAFWSLNGLDQKGMSL